MKKLFVIVCLFNSIQLIAQLNNESLYTVEEKQDTLKKDDIYLRVQGLGFMKNIENFGPMIDGYTLFGFQFNPQLGFQLSHELAIEGGVFLQKDFGNKDFSSIAPTFALKYHKKDFKMNFGTLDGSLNHNLIEPMYGFERFMKNRIENGAQFILNKKHFDFDIWIDWQNMLYKLVDDYERFWIGFSGDIYKLSNDKFEVSFPIQLTARHNGGQIARGGTIGKDKEGVYTNFNYSPGIKLKKIINNKGLQNIFTDIRYVANKNNSFDSTIYAKFGDGMLANIGAKVCNTDVMLSYWYGNNYTSEFGGDIYWSESTSVTYAGTYRTYRNVLILRVTKSFKLADNANLTLRLEPLYDIDFKRFHYSYGFYLNFDKKIRLKK